MDILKTVEKIAPQRRKMSYEEYLKFAGDTQIVEWVAEEAISYMPPTDTHQDLSGFLSTLLQLFVQFFELGVLRYAPFEVKLWSEGPAREPDILFIANKNLVNLGERRFAGAPDLIIEIISPSSAGEDRGRKFTQYEQAGVREYWLIDPRPRQQQADFYVLGSDGNYHTVPLTTEGRYQSLVLTNFWLDLDWLGQDALPNPQRAFAEIMVSIEGLPPEVKTIYQALLSYLSK